MSTTDRALFRTHIMHFKSNYNADGDAHLYCSKVAVSAVSLCMKEKNFPSALTTLFSLSSPVFTAAIDAVAHAVDCPVDHPMSALEFLTHFNEQVKKRVDSEYVTPAKAALKTVHDGLNSLLGVNPTCPHCRRSVPESNLIAHKCCGTKFCRDCSNGMLTRIVGNRYQLRCDCGATRTIEA
jgi:hypothetical protein